MPIQKLLSTSDFTPEQRRVCEMAFNNTKLSLVDRNDPLCEMIAHKIIGDRSDRRDKIPLQLPRCP